MRTSGFPENINELELVYLPKGKYCVYPRMVYRLAIVMPPPHFGLPKMNFDHISRHFISIRNFVFLFHKVAAGGHFGWLKISFDCISRHFRSIFKFYLLFILFTKWLPFWKSDLRQKQSGSSTICYQWLCQIWSWSVNLWHC